MMLSEVIGTHCLIFDGAMGTECLKKGLSYQEFSQSVMSHTEDIVDIHQSYLNAGANVLKTHTFSLSLDDLPEEEIHQLGIRACGLVKGLHPDFWVYDMSPAPLGWDKKKRRQRYQTQAKVALEEDCHQILLETFYDLRELKYALNCVEEVAPAIDVIASITNLEDLTVAEIEQFGKLANRKQVIALGINCVSDFNQVKSFLESFRQVSDFPVVISPNKGIPTKDDERLIYPVRDMEYLEGIAQIQKFSHVSIGGCCGTTPDMIYKITQI